MEVICIARSRSNPQAAGSVMVVDRPSRELLERLAAETRLQPGGGANPTVLQAAGGQRTSGGEPPPRWASRETAPVIRGQAGP